MIYVIYVIYVIGGSGALVNEKGEEQPLNAGDFALVNPEGVRVICIEYFSSMIVFMLLKRPFTITIRLGHMI